jgi:membrane fusion protein (multidrug efflux system)
LRAVQELQGQRSVLTLGADGTVQARTVATGDRIGERWIVERGLEPGEAVIVDGLQKVRPGARATARRDTPAPLTDGR